MCVRPLKILNRKCDKSLVFDRNVLTVPCGHCEECKKMKRNDWFVRLYYQFKECQLNNGFALFLTLTFDNFHLPKCHGFPCFDKTIVQKYVKRVRSEISRTFPFIDCKENVKYACFFEYGENTHRPHMHILWYFNCWFPAGIVRNIVKSQWLCGFTKFGSLNQGFVNDVGGIKYCAKYVSKSVYEDNYLKKLSIQLRNLGVSEEELKNFFPRPLCSNNLGLYALGFNDYETLLNGECIMPDKVLTEKMYRLPLYLERKLFYDVKFRVWDSECKDYVFYNSRNSVPQGLKCTPVYVLNENGLEMKKARFNKFRSAAENVHNVVSLCDIDVASINRKFDTNFSDVSSVKDFINVDLNTFVDYVSVYRGTVPASVTFSPLHLTSTPVEDFITMLEMTNGIVFDKSAAQSFLDNLLRFKSYPDIDLKVDIIFYIYSCARKSFEKKIIEDDISFGERKSVYLKQTELYI